MVGSCPGLVPKAVQRARALAVFRSWASETGLRTRGFGEPLLGLVGPMLELRSTNGAASEVPDDKGSGRSELEYTCFCCPVFDS